MTDEATAAARAEKEMALRQALKYCRKAVFWWLVFMSAIIMEGFNLALLSGFYASPKSLEAYGEKTNDNNKYEHPPSW
ncbi:hypothetical protein F5X99DRAFT_248006 [Biscogniauxia marginata]|nr:hypothetical protein F5X99DRAFT_248006 [Biscogniauxia marginata]